MANGDTPVSAVSSTHPAAVDSPNGGIANDSSINPYRLAIEARHSGEQSYLSIVNAHLLANTILFVAISTTLDFASRDYLGKFILTLLACVGYFIAGQTKRAFLIARANNICWDKIIKKYERDDPLFPRQKGGIYCLNDCVMKNGATCKISPIKVEFEDKQMRDAILERGKWYGRRMMLYPVFFKVVYMLLALLAWRNNFPSFEDLFLR